MYQLDLLCTQVLQESHSHSHNTIKQPRPTYCMLRPPLGAAMEGGRALWLALLLSAVMLASSSSSGDAAMAAGGQPSAGAGPDTNVLCVSKCGTCPTVCTSPPPPSPPRSSGGYSSPSPPGQSKGGRPSNYYYFFTAGGGRTSGGAGASVHALVLLVLASLLAGFQ